MSGVFWCILICVLHLSAIIGWNSALKDICVDTVLDVPETCASQYRTLLSIIKEYSQDSRLDSTSWILFKKYFQKQSHDHKIYQVACTLKDASYDLQVMMTSVARKASVYVLTIKCNRTAKLYLNTDISMNILPVKPIYIRIVDCIITNPAGLQLPMLHFLKDLKMTQANSYLVEMLDLNAIDIGSILGKVPNNAWHAIGHWYNGNVSTMYYLNKSNPIAPYILLSNWNIRSLPATLLKLPVIILNLNKNGIRNIDTLFEPNSYLLNNTHVLSINLASNKISDLRSFSSSGLTRLNLSHNRITHLNRETFKNLKSLHNLDVSWNRVKSIVPGTFQHSPLSTVNLNHNYLYQLSYNQVPGVPCTLNLSFNKFLKPPFYDSNYVMQSLMNVDIRGNPFQCDCSITRFREFLIADQRTAHLLNPVENIMNIHRISGAPFKNLKPVVCVEPLSLKDTPLSEVFFNSTCPVFYQCPDYCICDLDIASNITTVNCIEKNLQSLPVYAPEGTLKLLLSGNGMHSIPHQPFLQRVMVFNVSRNNINSIPVSVFKYAEEIYLSHNNLESLPTDLIQTNTSNIRRLDLSNNPWLCTCENAWLISWLSTHAQLLQRDVWCANGVLEGKSILSLTKEDLPCPTKSYMTAVVLLGIIVLLNFALLFIKFLRPFDVKVALWTMSGYPRYFEKDSWSYIDAYVYYTDDDGEWTREHIVDKLEGMKPAYKILDFERDCRKEQEQIFLTKKLPLCKRAIFILSDAFHWDVKALLQFHYIQDYFDSADHLKIIVIARKGFNFNLLPHRIQLRMTDNFLQYEDILFWPKTQIPFAT